MSYSINHSSSNSNWISTLGQPSNSIYMQVYYRPHRFQCHNSRSKGYFRR